MDRCDVAVIAFDPLDTVSIDYALQVTQSLPGELPRLMVGIKREGYRNNNEIGDGVNIPSQSSSFAKVEVFCSDAGLENQPLILSGAASESQQTAVFKAENGIQTLEERIVRAAADPSRRRKAIPKKFRSVDMDRIREILRTRMISNVKLGIGLGGLVVLGVAAWCMLWRRDNNSSRSSRDNAPMKGIDSIRLVSPLTRSQSQ